MEIRKAARQKAKLRLGLSGPSGSGKTFSAILLAKGVVGDLSKVGIIDTENGSADLYSHLGEFNVITLQAPYSPERYIEAIDAMEKAGMELIIIDSASHEWDGKGGALEINELLANTKFRGNTWAAWSETTPRHQNFLARITQSKVHLITTARAKTDMIQTEDKKIKKVGMKEIQREGFEYELTLNFTVDRDGHYARASKDRTGIFIDKDPFVITEETGKILKDWAESGIEPITPPDPKVLEAKRKVLALVPMLGVTLPADKEAIKTFLPDKVKEITGLELADENLLAIVAKLEAMVQEKNAKVKMKNEIFQAAKELGLVIDETGDRYAQTRDYVNGLAGKDVSLDKEENWTEIHGRLNLLVGEKREASRN
ncbi:MAG: ATP-binding protein [bacterium]|nr:ATP-binding protein [bacterium]